MNRYLSFLLLFILFFPGTVFSADTQPVQESRVVRDIYFVLHQDTLYGRVLLPGSSGPWPMVVFLSGSGPNSSYRTNYVDFLKYFLEEPLLKEGIGLMYFDKRGVGRSTGTWYRNDFVARAEEVSAAIDYITGTGQADPERICVVGHSQGAWISQISIAKYSEKIRCAVSMSGATFGVFEQLVNDYQSELMCRGKDSLRAHRKAVRKARLTMMATSMLPVTPNMKQLKLVAGFEPSGYLTRIRKPLLLTFSGNDELVYPSWCMRQLRKIFPDGIPPHFTVKTFPGTNHGYRLALFCSREGGQKGNYSPEARHYISGWIVEHLINE